MHFCDVYIDKCEYLCIYVCRCVRLAWLAGLAGCQAGREEEEVTRALRTLTRTLLELRLQGPSQTVQVSYKESFVLILFELRQASGIFGGLSWGAWEGCHECLQGYSEAFRGPRKPSGFALGRNLLYKLYVVFNMLHFVWQMLLSQATGVLS